MPLVNYKLALTFSSTIFVAGLFFVGPTTSFAQDETRTLTVSKDEYSLTASESTIKAWAGTYKRQRASTILIPRQSLNTLVGYYYLGSKRPANSTYQTYRYNPELIYRWVKEQAESIESKSENPELTIKNNRAVSFTPPTLGISVDAYTTTFNIIAALEEGYQNTDLAIAIVQPRKPLAATNNLGIRELVGHGESKFNGSPKNRRINIAVGVEKFKGVIIMPGEEFSFNKYLGPVEKEFGFVPELVIKASGTVPELGGGLCQVSSTTFRAAMNAGLPIVQRKNHSYAVQYYAPQGTDATIYPGVIDLKFTNDTPGAILVWPYLKDANTLIFDFYGTKDDREVELEKPVQYDRKSDGSMKATWVRHVTNNGETKTDTFNSVYLPPALFHKEETFVTTPPPTTPTLAPPVEQTNSEQINQTAPSTESTPDNEDQTP
ncbi:MAG: VanW family protein [Candidatus Doudnabacteria bacterium]|nr:VanW family protein [Candidatus Doudnabacteria bacterium]